MNKVDFAKKLHALVHEAAASQVDPGDVIGALEIQKLTIHAELIHMMNRPPSSDITYRAPKQKGE